VVGAYWDAIVDDQDSNATDKGNIYSTLQGAITAGAEHIFLRHCADTTDITITTADAVTLIQGSSTESALVPVNVVCTKPNVAFQFLAFTTAIVGGTAKSLTFREDDAITETGAGCIALGCLFIGAATPITATINDSGGISASDTSIGYNNAVGLPTAGIVIIEGEFISYTGGGGAASGTLTGCIRARHDTVAATHADGTAITSISSGHLVIDAARCQAVQNVFYNTSGAGAALWIRGHSNNLKVVSNNILGSENRFAIMVQPNTAIVPTGVNFAGNTIADYDGGDFVFAVMTADTGTELSGPTGWGFSGNLIRGFDTGAMLIRGQTWSISGNVFDGKTRITTSTSMNNGGVMGAADTSVTLTSAASFPARGRILIEDELIKYTGKSGNTLFGLTRGIGSTTAASHADGTTVFNVTQVVFYNNGNANAIAPTLFSTNVISAASFYYHGVSLATASTNLAFPVFASNITFNVTNTWSGVASQWHSNVLRITNFRWVAGINQSITGGYATSVFTNNPSDLTVSFIGGPHTGLPYIVGASTDPRLRATQPTLGNEVFRIESVATNDDPTEKVYQNRVATTDATVTTLHTYTIPASTTVGLEAIVVARRTGGAAGTAEDGAVYRVTAAIKNVAGTATQITGSPTVTVIGEDVAAYACTIDVNAATARVRVTGVANTNITWHLAALRVWQVSS
jgi:hypothetical protein